MHLPRFMLEKYEADFCNSVTNTGNRYVTNKAVGPSADQITFGASAEWMSQSLLIQLIDVTTSSIDERRRNTDGPTRINQPEGGA